MKRFFSILSLLYVMLICVSCQPHDTSEPVYFPDYQLELAIRDEINQQDGELHTTDLQSITNLDLSSKRIKSIEGLEYLDNVEYLNLQNNKIENLSPLEEMDSLKKVKIGGNPFNKSTLAKLEAKNITVHSDVAKEVFGTSDGPGGFLWKVENGDTTVYLQGTIHIATEDFFPLNEEIEAAYAEADIIVPEIDLNSLNLFETQAIYMDIAAYKDGTTIRDHIPNELYSDLSNTYRNLGLSVSGFEQYKPWFQASLIQQLMNEKLGYIDGVDLYFLDRAERDYKEVIGLETVEEQLSIFAETSLEYQIQMLEETLVELDEYNNQMEDMFSLYMEGDGEKLLSYLMTEDMEPTQEEQAFIQALNNDRNHHMADEIASFLEEDSGNTYFVIVGSLHLLLEPHIRTILEEKGYAIEKIL